MSDFGDRGVMDIDMGGVVFVRVSDFRWSGGRSYWRSGV